LQGTANTAQNITNLMILARDDEVSEAIVFALSFISFGIILFYVLYEVFQPLLKFEKYNEATRLEYYRRYNREEYLRMKPEVPA
jgi:hypothetical protein